jgi:hypothetical protein
MNEAHTSSQDRPIQSSSSDELDRGPFVESLIRALVAEKSDKDGRLIGRRGTGYVVGLTGKWGAGKSSVLNLLSAKLGEMDHVVVATFNPWLFSGRDELVSGFFAILRGALGRSVLEEARSVSAALDRYWGAIKWAGHGIAALVDASGAAGAATATWTSVGSSAPDGVFKLRELTPDEERFHLEQKLSESQLAVVVLIDELDRIEDHEVRAVAQLVKAVGDIKGLSYPERVVEALGRGSDAERRLSGERYLEKIIQYPIPLRPLFVEDTRVLLNSAIRNQNSSPPTPRGTTEEQILSHLLEALQTPREIKRLAGAYTILERAVRGEISPMDVLAYSWIATKSPLLRASIEAHIDDLVNDPVPKEVSVRLVRQMNKESDPDIVEILGPSAEEHRHLLGLLFPRITDEVNADGRERLATRRNLVRMLYLGNPPGAVRRAEVEAAWGQSDLNKLEADLRTWSSEGRLNALLERLDEIWHTLPEVGDQTFWVALSRSLIREHGWITENTGMAQIAGSAAEILHIAAKRDSAMRHRVLSAIASLNADGDLVIVPDILRANIFAHGLAHAAPRGSESLTLEETNAILTEELPRYRQAIIDGTLLQRLPAPEILYIHLNLDVFDDQLKSSLNDQLNNNGALWTLACLMVPPSHRVDQSTWNRIIDIEATRLRLDLLNSQGNIPKNSWVQECVGRMTASLDRG